ncbi:transmembrane transport protein [Bifidobacterium pullorum subsp. gallinarum]|uniref:Transmembrane transport protein n=1 Tax=Bifidobacterium pullorum subsp. gallinarum TaxID=78344 RepID=A0A087AM47_9BIFI|nr:DUF2975 domain-containing protein [Bifidobacterium pullorum]KFI59847.1 transmembrane transport protein [Bifidobacterium pullorum subsp. gallinarum]
MTPTPQTHPVAIRMLKALIALLLAIAAAVHIWLLPAVSSDFAVDAPEFAYLRIPYLIVCELLMLGFDIALIAIWRLLSLTASSSVFSDAAFRWVGLIIGCISFDTALVIGLLAHNLIASLGPPILVIALTILTVVGTALTLLMIVMRGLLAAATAQREELEAVI